MLKERRSAGVSRVCYYRIANAGSRLAPSHVRLEDVTAARIPHLSGITPALSARAREATFRALELARTAETTVCVDINYRTRLWPPEEARAVLVDMIQRSDVVLATSEEASLLTDGPRADPIDDAERLARLGPRLAVIKRGAEGAVAWDDGRIHVIDANRADVIDPVGAGDAFAAGLLADLSLGHTAAQALATAAAVAAVKVACPGDWEGLPTRADLRQHLGDDIVR